MELLWIVGLLLMADAFVLVWLLRSGKAPNLPPWMPWLTFAIGAGIFVISLLA